MKESRLKQLQEIVALLNYDGYHSEARLLADVINQAQADSARLAHLEGKKNGKRLGVFGETIISSR